MAILNYLQSGTYTVVERFIYTKGCTQFNVQLYVYEDITKNNLLMEQEFIMRHGNTPLHTSHIDVTEPPANFVAGDVWITHPTDYTDGNPMTPIGRTIVTVMEDLSFWYRAAGHMELFYDDVNLRFFNVTQQGIIEADPVSDPDLYDQYFNLQENDNIVKQIYLFLLNECVSFRNCTAG